MQGTGVDLPAASGSRSSWSARECGQISWQRPAMAGSAHFLGSTSLLSHDNFPSPPGLDSVTIKKHLGQGSGYICASVDSFHQQTQDPRPGTSVTSYHVPRSNTHSIDRILGQPKNSMNINGQYTTSSIYNYRLTLIKSACRDCISTNGTTDPLS